MRQQGRLARVVSAFLGNARTKGAKVAEASFAVVVGVPPAAEAKEWREMGGEEGDQSAGARANAYKPLRMPRPDIQRQAGAAVPVAHDRAPLRVGKRQGGTGWAVTVGTGASSAERVLQNVNRPPSSHLARQPARTWDSEV